MIESYHIRLYVCRVSEGYDFRDALKKIYDETASIVIDDGSELLQEMES